MGDATVKYLMLIKHTESLRSEPIPQALMDAMGEFIDMNVKSGVLKDTGGLKATSEGLRVRLSGGKLKVTDGPFTEAKEVIGGYAMVDVGSKDEARDVARQFMELHRVHWPKWEGEIEIRLMYEESDDVQAAQVEASRLLEHGGSVRGHEPMV